jgi:hypothetical protein
MDTTTVLPVTGAAVAAVLLAVAVGLPTGP